MKPSRTVVGVDTAKRVFQLYWVDMKTGEIMGLKLTRAKFLEHFAKLYQVNRTHPGIAINYRWLLYAISMA